MIDDELLGFARDNLEKRISALNNAEFGDVVEQDFSFHKIRAGFEPGGIRNLIRPSLGDVTNCAAIYRLTVNDQATADMLQMAFEQFRPPDGLKLARNNHVADSRTVYVGSSKDVGARLHQHLHFSANGTYALKLHLWCPDADSKINVEVTPVRGEAEASLVQDVEDALWERSHPMFGKFGAK
ncbi:hypothetical protein [Limimaricola sp. AA108-03]|uniref:hypothetical protein n=1 Tax=Limimaricola sp. AA108-03 TaxID=3425945 RepID=UPI003D78AFD4